MPKPYVTLQNMKRTLLRRQSLWITTISLLLLGGLVLGIRSPHAVDPVYKGRHLSEWMAMVRDDPVLSTHDPRSQEAARAIREIGTNAIPPLLDWIAYEHPIVRYHLEGLPQWVLSRLPFSPETYYNEVGRAQRAISAFGVLGPAAASAVPELVHRASRPASVSNYTSRKRTSAILALAKIGAPAVPFFQAELSSPGRAGDSLVLFSVIQLGTNARPLVPLLIKNLGLTNSRAVRGNLYTLGALKLDPEIVIPAVTGMLQDPLPDVRIRAADTLAKFGPLAAPALPGLTNLLLDTDGDVRKSAADAISYIAPVSQTRGSTD